jgi:outer membrane protein assembly factor BamB
MLDSGHILIFDNGTYREWSRVVEMDPATGRIVWEYRGDPPEAFYSKWRGSNQRFPNGNTLICESERGHVFEVAENGEIVWEFWNPDLVGGSRRRIYRLLRVPAERVLPFLELRAGP